MIKSVAVFLLLSSCFVHPLLGQEEIAAGRFARQGFDFAPPPDWGHREVSADEVEFVGPSNGTFAPRIQVKRLFHVLFVGEKQEELRKEFVDEFRHMTRLVPEIVREEILSENGRDVLEIEAKTRFRGGPCRIIRRWTSSADRGYQITYYDAEEAFVAQQDLVRAALSSFDTDGGPSSEWTLLYQLAFVLVLAGGGVYYWLDRKRERRVVGEEEELDVELRSADGEYILPIEDIESPGRLVARRGSHGPSHDGGVNEYDISFFGGGDTENKEL